jgi:hypothetical protein
MKTLLNLFGLLLMTQTAGAAFFTVNYNGDDEGDANPADGICETSIGNGQCTLRAAIESANHTPGGPHTVLVPYLENDSYPVWAADGIWISTNMTVRGTGAGKPVIEGDLFIEGGMLNIGNQSTVENLEFRPSTTSGSSVQGIYVNSLTMATMNDVTIRAHESTAGLLVFNGKLTCNRCELVDGDNLGLRISGSGGNDVAYVLLNESRVSGNENHSNNSGGGVWLQLGRLVVRDSLIDNNQAIGEAPFDGHGGGIYMSDNINTSLQVINSTISGNKAHGDGGGIYAQNPVRLENATITGNYADYNDDNSGTGGGVYISDFTDVIAKNSIIHGNYLPCAPGTPICIPDGRNCDDTQGGTIGISSLGWVMVGTDGHCPLTDLTGETNYTSTAFPQLGPLTDLGGAQPVHPILDAGLEADGGDPDGCSYQVVINNNPVELPLDFDQRGMTRPQDSDGNAFDGNSCDIGAYEAVCFGDDPDGDYVGSDCDVCPAVFDPLQEDGNQDGIGDACSGDLIFFSGFD